MKGSAFEWPVVNPFHGNNEISRAGTLPISAPNSFGFEHCQRKEFLLFFINSNCHWLFIIKVMLVLLGVNEPFVLNTRAFGNVDKPRVPRFPHY
jgi:hypothetical protein